MRFFLGLILAFLVSGFSSAAINYRNMTETTFDRIEKKYGFDARVRVSDWGLLLNRLAEQVPQQDAVVIREANDFFNKVNWIWDIDHWGQEDYWATPIETLGTNGGDCEDYSIGKYFSLTSMGMKTSKLRITYVKALRQNLAHMVLAYYPTPSSEPLILDNINKTILPASKRTDLLPIYSFNGDGLWLARSRAQAVKGDITKNVPSWGSLRGKMEAELQ